MRFLVIAMMLTPSLATANEDTVFVYLARQCAAVEIDADRLGCYDVIFRDGEAGDEPGTGPSETHEEGTDQFDFRGTDQLDDSSPLP